MDKKDLTLGQPVKVYDYRGKPSDGVITKIGRLLVTIEHGGWATDQFRIDTQRVSDGYGYSYFRTLPQVEEERRRRRWDAVRNLHTHGFEIRLGYDRTITTDTIERVIAALEHQPPA